MRDAPTPGGPPESSNTLGIDAISYALAVLSILPFGGAFVLWCIVGSEAGDRQANPFMTWRRTTFDFFNKTEWFSCLLVASVSASLAGTAFVISRPRRKSSRLAAAGVRLGIAGLVLAAIGAALVSGFAAYQSLH